MLDEDDDDDDVIFFRYANLLQYIDGCSFVLLMCFGLLCALWIFKVCNIGKQKTKGIRIKIKNRNIINTRNGKKIKLTFFHLNGFLSNATVPIFHTNNLKKWFYDHFQFLSLQSLAFLRAFNSFLDYHIPFQFSYAWN